ncbi:MAG: hypothetical protein COA32_15355 [Fluviicola sp.]|nr:MAG: hypothetical protein COA32_15355 [Fluviicola sp.]
MEELSPLTISNSVLGDPTVLLTKDLETYTLYRPVDNNIRTSNEILDFLSKHFKIDRLKVGVFNLKGKKYYCYQEIDGAAEFDSWNVFLWDSKRKFNQFLSPKTLFSSFLVDLYFPLFNGSKRYILAGKKNQFAIHPVPENEFTLLSFEPTTPAQLGMTLAGISSFFKHMKNDLLVYLEDFEALNHNKLKADLKYRVSLYPEVRNIYWNEMQKCFDPEFMNYTNAELKNYILKL